MAKELKCLRGSEIKERKPSVTVTKRWVTFKTAYHRGIKDEYFFETNRVNTLPRLVGMVLHLGSKLWFDGLVCQEFILKVAEHFGWTLFTEHLWADLPRADDAECGCGGPCPPRPPGV